MVCLVWFVGVCCCLFVVVGFFSFSSFLNLRNLNQSDHIQLSTSSLDVFCSDRVQKF